MPVEKTNSPKGILVLNAGSSSIKFSLFASPELSLLYSGIVREIYNNPVFVASDEHKNKLAELPLTTKDHLGALREILKWLDTKTDHLEIEAIGHRVVHGANEFADPIIVTSEVINKLEKLIPLAPLHQGHNLEAIKIMTQLDPNIPQVACFDTSFHKTQQALSKMVPLPESFRKEGIERYGFHGLSYEYIAKVLPEKIGALAGKKIIVAHLGNGASVCAMHQRKSVSTSMGFTALEGLMMGTRTGSLDPGILLYLMQEKNYSIDKLSELLYQQSGLLGVSNISSDMRLLLENGSTMANKAIDLFCYRAAKEIGALIVTLKGCDAIIFTAGIGENCPPVREKIIEWFDWLGATIHPVQNQQNAFDISASTSKIKIYVIPTNEEWMIAKETFAKVNV